MSRRTLHGVVLTAAFLVVLLLAAPAGAIEFTKLARGADQRCLDCHSKPDLGVIMVDGERKSLTVDSEKFHGSQHGRLDCTACHSGFKPRQHTAAEAAGWYEQARLNACSDCHADQFAMYRGSFHGNLVMKEGDKRAPRCADCHGSHGIVGTKSPGFRDLVLPMCEQCHEEKAGTYLDTYHGKSVRLGNDRTAVCTDCHGHHLILPASNPNSTISKEHLVQTCQKCHPKANQKFTGFLVHVDRSDPKSSIWVFLMELSHGALIGALFLVGGLHCFLYFYRGLKEGMYSRGGH